MKCGTEDKYDFFVDIKFMESGGVALELLQRIQAENVVIREREKEGERKSKSMREVER